VRQDLQHHLRQVLDQLVRQVLDQLVHQVLDQLVRQVLQQDLRADLHQLRRMFFAVQPELRLLLTTFRLLLYFNLLKI
jgi:hypothetical protein